MFHRVLQFSQLFGLLAVVLASQRDWFTSSTAALVRLSSPGRNGTPPGLVVLGVCVASLMWMGWRWAQGKPSIAVPLAAAVTVLTVAVHQVLTVPGAPQMDRFEDALWLMSGGVVLSLFASLALNQLEDDGALRRGPEAGRSPHPIAPLGFAVFGIGSLLPWRQSSVPFISVTENEVWLGSVLGLGTVITVLFALALCRNVVANGTLVMGPLEILCGIVVSITIYVFVGLIPYSSVSPGLGFWVMTVGASFASLGTFERHLVSQT